MSPAHQSGRRRYAERGAAETATSTPAVGHQRASDKRIQISAAEADAMIAREATKHTPGPWRAHRCPIAGAYRFGFIIQGQPLGVTIASLIPGSSTDRIPEIADANARLIAAAPDLLAAAEDALAVLTIDLRGLNVAKPEIEKLRVAIAKAKGNA